MTETRIPLSKISASHIRRARRPSTKVHASTLELNVTPTPSIDRADHYDQSQEGAILILALVFILLIAFSVLGLLTFGGTGITDATSLQGQRDLQYSADGAITAAIQSVRYTSNYYDVVNQEPTTDCLPNGVPSMTLDGDQMTVGCTGTLALPVPQQNTRVITFYACLGSASGTASPCSYSNAIVAVTVDFQDISSSGFYDCSDPADSLTCGTGMTIANWVVLNSGSNNA
jgi:hypothetical protein